MTPIYCYSNNGLSWRLVDESYQAQDGEVIFYARPTQKEIASAFKTYPVEASDASIKQQIAALESKATPRMLREAVAGSDHAFAGGPFKGKTSSQALASIQSQITALRAKLS